MGNCCKKQTSAPNKGVGTSSATEIKEDELRAVFKEFDIDGDNFIQEHELKSVMSKMGQSPTPEELHAMFKAADCNGDGKIDFEEFVAIARANPLSLSLKSVFGELDVDGDGYITRSEMRVAFDKMGHSLNDDEINAIFRQCDMNQDGKINFDEFVSMMCKKRGK